MGSKRNNCFWTIFQLEEEEWEMANDQRKQIIEFYLYKSVESVLFFWFRANVVDRNDDTVFKILIIIIIINDQQQEKENENIKFDMIYWIF